MGMTREEAIAEIKYYMESDSYADAPSNEACKMAINALRPVSREQVERVRGEWINTNKEVEQMCKCSKCGYPISYFWSRTPFCPNCGAPMTDEAVDMVLKRLEVPKDDQT
jgi:hypothetical protein